jgi:hypothetical protein
MEIEERSRGLFFNKNPLSTPAPLYEGAILLLSNVGQ